MRSQPHFLAVLLLGGGRLYPLNRRLGASQSLCGRFAARNSILSRQGRQNERSYASTFSVWTLWLVKRLHHNLKDFPVFIDCYRQALFIVKEL